MNIEHSTPINREQAFNAQHPMVGRVTPCAPPLSRLCKSVTTESINQAMMPGMKTQVAVLTNAEAQRTQSQTEKGMRNFLRDFLRSRRLCIKFPLASLLLCVFALMPLGLRATTNDLTSALQKGLFEEEANRNLDAAISNYQSLAAQFDQDRQIAATAIFRLGECYRKLGQTNDAVVQYQRILREFSDQQTLATLSRQNLTGLETTPQASSTPATTDESMANIEKQVREISQLMEPLKAQQAIDSRRKALRERFDKKSAQDQHKYTPEQLRDAEELYRVANQKWGSAEATESLQTMIKKYPDINRAGCATLYLAQTSQGEERAGYLQDCIEKYNDCFYGDGVQVGAYARFLLAQDYRSKGEEKKSEALSEEIKTQYSDAIDHGGNLLVDSLKTDSK
jgi:tetratricopeptide (TPR) repeat protein